ncbi:uncharacterized protein N7458_005532 [Penicillium daleae]|uniref:Uncharacterized protein n=1 Tax=Penicillium daleae TaxID=63821 RepID=A0AAD6C873_9EURO|nr:uncharacterized protein N7458_005532 [Penicillium daleae]KAJ5454576.1 hypothetical protein N7458_005532 [Penicillium daleae]
MSYSREYLQEEWYDDVLPLDQTLRLLLKVEKYRLNISKAIEHPHTYKMCYKSCDVTLLEEGPETPVLMISIVILSGPD